MKHYYRVETAMTRYYQLITDEDNLIVENPFIAEVGLEWIGRTPEEFAEGTGSKVTFHFKQ
jgi:hypothetical protein